MHSPFNSFVKVLQACESASGAGSKDIIKKALATLDLNGQTLFKYAMDPFLVYGVKKFDMPSDVQWCAYSGTDNYNLKIVTDVLDKLAARELTGNAARTEVTSMLAEFTEETAQYLARIIGKDLKAGFSDETYNKIHKTNPVRVFNVQLADKCADADEFEKYITFPCQADHKFDGERNIAFQLLEESNFAPAGSSYRSRSGKIAEHMNGLFDEELARIRDYLGYDFVLDGERMAKNFTDTMNAKKAGKDGEAGKANMRFRAFFLMPLTDWIAQKTTITTRENRVALEKILRECKCTKIILSEGREVTDYSDMVEFCDEVTTPGFAGLVNGQEGLILKDWNSTYEWSRSMSWCKVKKFYDADARIISWEFGRNKNAKRMGRVNVAGWLEDGTYFEVGVGSGWTDKQRDDAALTFDENWLGRTVVVKYQEVSKGKNKEHASLRFPTVDQEKLFRDDKIVPLKD